MPDASVSSKLSLDQIQRIIRKNLKQIAASFPEYFEAASVACEQLVEVNSKAYGLMTRVNVLVLADLCSQVHAAVDNTKVIVKDESEFAARFAEKIALAESLIDQLETMLVAEQMGLLKKNVINRELVAFLKEHSTKLQALLFELQFPYGKCTCGKAKQKPFHSKCGDCFGAEIKKTSKKVEDVFAAPPAKTVAFTEPAPGMTTLEAAFLLAEAEQKAKAEKRKKNKKGRNFGQDEHDYIDNKARSGRRGRGHEEDW